MLKALEGEDDGLAELRRMIKETGSSLEGCSRKLNKSKKYIMQVADRYFMYNLGIQTNYSLLH